MEWLALLAILGIIGWIAVRSWRTKRNAVTTSQGSARGQSGIAARPSRAFELSVTRDGEGGSGASGKGRNDASAAGTGRVPLQASSPEYSVQAEFSILHGLLSIDELDFTGHCSRSPDRRFILAWADHDPTSGVIGARDSGPGRYLLLRVTGEQTGPLPQLPPWLRIEVYMDGEPVLEQAEKAAETRPAGRDDAETMIRGMGQVVAEGTIERPNDGKVSNSGRCILNDWMFSQELCGTFYAFSATGETLVRHSFDANLLNNGISDDGRFAVCQTCRSESEDDSGVLCLFDLEEGAILARFRPEPGWADEYAFEPETQTLHLIYRDGRRYRYSFDGNFLDAALWEAERLYHVPGELFAMVDSRLKRLSGTDLATYSEVTDWLERALDKGVPGDWHGGIHRRLADIYYRCNEDVRASEHAKHVSCYDLVEMADGRLKALSGSDLAVYSEVLEWLKRALEADVSQNTEARIHRRIGEIYHQCNDTDRALEHLETALRLNPKVGVKRLMKRLRSG
jgi:hypothetical protein